MVSIRGLFVHQHGSGLFQKIIKGVGRLIFQNDYLNVQKMPGESQQFTVQLGGFSLFWDIATISNESMTQSNRSVYTCCVDGLDRYSMKVV